MRPNSSKYWISVRRSQKISPFLLCGWNVV